MSLPTRTALAVAGVFVLVLGLLTAHWLGFLLGNGKRPHDAAVRLWESKEPAAYSFDYTSCSGMCASCPLHVTVRHGVVTDAVPSEPSCEYAAEHAPTVEDVFAREAADRAGPNTASFAIDYDPTWGFPQSVEIRCPDGWTDCGSGYAITHFRVEP